MQLEQSQLQSQWRQKLDTAFNVVTNHRPMQLVTTVTAWQKSRLQTVFQNTERSYIYIYSESGRFISVSTLQKESERGTVSSALWCTSMDPISLKAETNPSIRGRFRTANTEREWENDVRVFKWKLSSREKNLGRVLWKLCEWRESESESFEYPLPLREEEEEEEEEERD